MHLPDVRVDGARCMIRQMSLEEDCYWKEQVNRQYVTGSDRKGTTVVRGRLVHVVHGFHSISFPSHLRLQPDDYFRKPGLANGNRTPCTLIVLEWNMTPGSVETRHRFRAVRISLVFFASDSRPGVPPGGNLSAWDPVPKRIVPSEEDPKLSRFTPVSAVSSSELSFGPTVGYDGIASVNAEYSKGRSVAVQYTASALITGKICHEGRVSGDPNAVQFVFLENKDAKTGVPPVVRTAILLRREDIDLKGRFAMTVEVSTDVNWWQDSKEKMRRAVGARLLDDPVNFDPSDPYVLQNGEKVERKNCKIRGVDWRRLGEVNLNQFLVDYSGPPPSSGEDDDSVSDASDESAVWEDAQESL
ncbi:hypothetical protein NEUTE2DRAFT_155189 [Neurospora tetrasperma FGSC 2509]|nr:hypothetical protein NEUTE2DRAFT_155189 [Neurospora tetrasperma FGSC 2509]